MLAGLSALLALACSIAVFVVSVSMLNNSKRNGITHTSIFFIKIKIIAVIFTSQCLPGNIKKIA